MVREVEDFDRRIADLASFLDPVAFGRERDRSLEKRRQAARRKAANRLVASTRDVTRSSGLG